jgi:hypothetical protein
VLSGVEDLLRLHWWWLWWLRITVMHAQVMVMLVVMLITLRAVVDAVRLDRPHAGSRVAGGDLLGVSTHWPEAPAWGRCRRVVTQNCDELFCKIIAEVSPQRPLAQPKGSLRGPSRARQSADGPQGRDSQRRSTEQLCRARGPSQKGDPWPGAKYNEGSCCWVPLSPPQGGVGSTSGVRQGIEG